MTSNGVALLATLASYISFGHNPKNVIDVVRDVKSKLFHDRNADDVSNSVGYPRVKFFGENGLPKLAP